MHGAACESRRQHSCRLLSHLSLGRVKGDCSATAALLCAPWGARKVRKVRAAMREDTLEARDRGILQTHDTG